MKRLGHLLSESSVFIAVFIMFSCSRHVDLPVIPAPEHMAVRMGHFRFTEDTVISVENDIQKTVADRFAWLFAEPAGFVPRVLPGVEDADVRFVTDPDMEEEAYVVEVSRKEITVTASSTEGFIYALQTIRLSLPGEISSPVYAGDVKWEIPVMTIRDSPRFHHRCLRLDLDRIAPDDDRIFHILDCMALLKYNYLHLDAGAYAGSDDLKEITDYARKLHIKVNQRDKGDKTRFKEYCDDPQWLEPLVSFSNKSLKDIYYYEPIADGSIDDFHEFLMGLFSESWINSCSNSEDIDEMLLPRLAALAEIAWSPKGSKDWARFSSSMNLFASHVSAAF